MLGFARFIMFDGDINYLQKIESEAKEKFILQQFEDDDDELHLSEAFKGHLDPISLQNEAAVWKHIDLLADAALAKYPTTLKEDL